MWKSPTIQTIHDYKHTSLSLCGIFFSILESMNKDTELDFYVS